MKARLTFPGVTSFNQSDGDELDVEKSVNAFVVELIDSPPDGFDWGTRSSDRVLDLSGDTAGQVKISVTPSKVGTSKLLVMEGDDSVLFRLIINVVASEEAGSLSIPPGSEEDLPM